jgi:hypothetical protein
MYLIGVDFKNAQYNYNLKLLAILLSQPNLTLIGKIVARPGFGDAKGVHGSASARDSLPSSTCRLLSVFFRNNQTIVP